MATHSRQSSNIVNVIPWTYTDETVDEQASRPRVGDMWITETDDELRTVEHKEPLTIVKVAKVKIHQEKK